MKIQTQTKEIVVRTVIELRIELDEKDVSNFERDLMDMSRADFVKLGSEDPIGLQVVKSLLEKVQKLRTP